MQKLLSKKRTGLLFLGFFFLSLCLFSSGIQARETDQYTLPEKKIGDIGPILSKRVYDALMATAEKLNREILACESKISKLEASYRTGNLSLNEFDSAKESCLQKKAAVRDPEKIARTFNREIAAGILFFSGELERWVESDEVLAKFTIHDRDAKVVFAPYLWETVYHISSGLRAPLYFLLSPTINAFGVEFGLDKLGHFMNEGFEYYKIFLKNTSLGKNVRDSERSAVKYYGIASEGSIYGMVISGVYSNADLAAAYAGMKFYRNLTVSVAFGGMVYPAMFDIAGNGTLRINKGLDEHRMSFFSNFITPHFNEALNPSLYSISMRALIGRNVKKRCGAWRERFKGHGAEYFEAITRGLFLWHREDYGHSDDYDALVTIDKTCFD